MQPQFRLLVAVWALALCWAGAAGALGMKVSPGGALIQNVAPGEPVELNFPLTVINEDDQAHTVTFEALRPSRQKMNLPAGYSDIPDTAWLRFSKSEIQVPAKGTMAVRMTLSIPKGDEYCDQHWSVSVAVRSKPAENQTIALALYPRFEIETTPSVAAGPGRPAGSKGRTPLGPIVVTPSVATVGLDGGAQPVELTIWNNTDKPWQGEAAVIAGDEAAKKDRLELSSGYQWPPSGSSLQLPSSALQVGPKATAAFKVNIIAPSDAGNRARRWEAILLFKGKESPSAIARIRCERSAKQ